MGTKRTNASVRKTINTSKGLIGIKTLQLPGAVELKQNKNWIDKWMKQNERMSKMRTSRIHFSKTPGLIMNWWEN